MSLLELFGVKRWQQFGDIVKAVAKGSSIRETGDRSAANRFDLALVDYVRQIADGARPLLATSMNSSTVNYLNGKNVRWALTLDWTRKE